MKSIAYFALALAAASVSASAAITYDVDVNDSSKFTSIATSNSTSPVTYNYDYSTQGIPLAPGASTTRAMRLQANVGPTATAGGVTLTPIGITAPANYKVSATVWMNTFGTFNGTLSNGSGTTQFFGVGGSYTGGVNYRAGAAVGGGSGTWFAADNEGGFSATSTTIREYSAFIGSGATAANFLTAASVYAAGSQDNANAYYTTNFPLIDVTTVNGGTLASIQNASVSPSSPQAPATAGQTAGAGVAGAQAFSWRDIVIERVGSTVTWRIDGKLIATVVEPNVASGGISLTYFDASSNISQFTGLNEALVSSLSITVPEPTSVVALAMTGLLIRRRK